MSRRYRFSANSLRALPAFFNFSIISPVKTVSFSVALFHLPGKLREFNNIGSFTGILHITNLFIKASLKVGFSLLGTVNSLNLKRFIRTDDLTEKLRTDFEKLCCLPGTLMVLNQILTQRCFRIH